ncbi:hypothetical protein Tco_0360579 [Tanacetum coccineum]
MSSDSTSSEVTYTSISSHGDPLAWAIDFFRLQELDLLKAALTSLDYVPGPEEPEQAPPSPDYDPSPEYPEYLAPADDEIIAEDQPYADYASPTTLSPGYVADSDPEEGPEEDPENGPVDYPVDGGNDDDDDDSSDNDEEEEEASEAEGEHLALADSIIAPTIDYVPSFEETEPFKTDESVATPSPPPTCRTTTRMSIQAQAPMPFPSEEEVERLLYLPPPVLTTSPLPLPPLPASLSIPPPVDHREDISEVELPPRKSLCMTALTSGYKVGESSTVARPTGGHRADYGFISTLDAETRRQRAEEVSYGIRDVWVDPAKAVEEVAPTTLEGINARVTELVAVQEEDTQDIYAVIEDAQDRQTQLS